MSQPSDQDLNPDLDPGLNPDQPSEVQEVPEAPEAPAEGPAPVVPGADQVKPEVQAGRQTAAGRELYAWEVDPADQAPTPGQAAREGS